MKVTARGLPVLLSLAACWACGGEPPPAEVTVAVAMPFTGAGVMTEARQAWELVVERVNDSGGVAGARIEVYERDTPLEHPSDLAPVARGFSELAASGYKYIISLVSGSALEPMLAAAVPNGVLAMSVASEEPADDLARHEGMLLRGILSTDRVIAKQAAAMQAQGLRSLAIVGETRAGQLDPRHAMMLSAYRACGECEVSSFTYPAEADLYRYDWASLGRAVASANPDAVYLATANGGALLDVLHWTESLGFAGPYHFAYGAYMSSLLPALPGSPAPARFRAYDLALPPGEQLSRFLSLYEATYDAALLPEPRLLAFADYLVLVALAMTHAGSTEPRAVADAIASVASPPGEEYGPLDYAAAVEALAAGHDIDFQGLSGAFDFDARGEVSDGFVVEYGLDSAGNVVALP